jgi:hypothetical protein
MKVVGRVDKADFPEFSLVDIDVKVDTGAYTSTIHCHDIKEVIIDGMKHIEFELLDPAHPHYQNIIFKTKQYKKRRVKNSFGKSEKRYVIKTTIVMFKKTYRIELSLSERSDMKYPILLGRKLLNRRFVVDTSKQNLSYKLKQGKK